ncbi:MAG: hypothetical protein AAF961_09945, partial [Planctomycetota bacterium]
MTRKPWIASLALLAAFAPPTSFSEASDAGASVVNSGPVTLTVSVDKELAQVADPVRFTLEARAPRGA